MQKTNSVNEAPKSDQPLRLQSRLLFAQGPEVLIEHDGACYRLRLTASGKLILTK
jgi:hemin uptake protein HemP